MAIMRGTLVFSIGRYTWSETYYQEEDTVEAVLTDLKKLAPVRLSLCGTGVKIIYQRASNVDHKRDSLIDDQQYQTFSGESPFIVQGLEIGPKGVKIPADLAADVPYSGVLIRQQLSGSAYWRMMTLRGIPDVFLRMNPQGPELNQGWMGNFSEYERVLKRDHWGANVLSREDNNPAKAIQNVGATGPFVVTCGAHGFVTGDEVRVYSVKGDDPKKVNGVHDVEVVDANSFKLKGTTGSFTYNKGGFAIKRVRIFKRVSQLLIRGQASRKTGGSFFLPVGRQKAR